MTTKTHTTTQLAALPPPDLDALLRARGGVLVESRASTMGSPRFLRASARGEGNDEALWIESRPLPQAIGGPQTETAIISLGGRSPGAVLLERL